MSLGLQDPFRRDGHLSHMAVEGWVLELLGDSRGTVHAHLEQCPQCRHRVDEVIRHERGVMQAPSSVSDLPTPANRGRFAMLAAMTAAAVAMVAVLPEEPEMRRKGGDFAMTVFADEGDHARALESKDVVDADQRIGFQVQIAEPGHVVIVGVDDRGGAYPCYPLDGASASLDTRGAVDLKAAVQLDGLSGTEHLVGLLCDEPVEVAEVVTRLQEATADDPAGLLGGTLVDGCLQYEVVLTKEAR